MSTTLGAERRFDLDGALELQAPDSASRAIAFDAWSMGSGYRDVYVGQGRWLLYDDPTPPRVFVGREGGSVYTAPSDTDPLVWTEHRTEPVQFVDEAGLPLAGQLIRWTLGDRTDDSEVTDLQGRAPMTNPSVAMLAGAVGDLGDFGPVDNGMVMISRAAPSTHLPAGAPPADSREFLGRWASPAEGRSRVEFITPVELGQASLIGGRLKLGEKRELIVLDATQIVVDERWRTVAPEPTPLVREQFVRVRNNRRWATPQFGLSAGDTATIRTTSGEGELIEQLVVEADGDALVLRRTLQSADQIGILIAPRGVRIADGHFAGIGDARRDKDDAFEQVLGAWGRVGGLWRHSFDLEAWEFAGFEIWLLEGGFLMDRQLVRDVIVREQWHWSDESIWDVDLVYTGREPCFDGGPRCAVVQVDMIPAGESRRRRIGFELVFDPRTMRPFRKTDTPLDDDAATVTWTWK